MKKKYTFLIICLTLFLTISPLFAQKQWAIGGQVGFQNLLLTDLPSSQITTRDLFIAPRIVYTPKNKVQFGLELGYSQNKNHRTTSVIGGLNSSLKLNSYMLRYFQRIHLVNKKGLLAYNELGTGFLFLQSTETTNNRYVVKKKKPVASIYWGFGLQYNVNGHWRINVLWNVIDFQKPLNGSWRLPVYVRSNDLDNRIEFMKSERLRIRLNYVFNHSDEKSPKLRYKKHFVGLAGNFNIRNTSVKTQSLSWQTILGYGLNEKTVLGLKLRDSNSHQSFLSSGTTTTGISTLTSNANSTLVNPFIRRSLTNNQASLYIETGIKINTVHLNVLTQITNGTTFTDSEIRDKYSTLSPYIALGIDYQLTEKWMINAQWATLEYTWFKAPLTNNFYINGKEGFNLQINQISIGLNYLLSTQ